MHGLPALQEERAGALQAKLGRLAPAARLLNLEPGELHLGEGAEY